jgi:hypothetical protein
MHIAGSIKAYFKGNGTNVLKIAPETSIKLGLNDYLKRVVPQVRAAGRLAAGVGPTLCRSCCLGLLAGKHAQSVRHGGCCSVVSNTLVQIIRHAASPAPRPHPPLPPLS